MWLCVVPFKNEPHTPIWRRCNLYVYWLASLVSHWGYGSDGARARVCVHTQTPHGAATTTRCWCWRHSGKYRNFIIKKCENILFSPASKAIPRKYVVNSFGLIAYFVFNGRTVTGGRAHSLTRIHTHTHTCTYAPEPVLFWFDTNERK